jgi:hypothetical protein
MKRALKAIFNREMWWLSHGGLMWSDEHSMSFRRPGLDHPGRDQMTVWSFVEWN